MRSIKIGGIVAAPVTATRKLLKSAFCNPGWASNDKYKVGGPGNTVILSLLMRLNTSSASNIDCGNIVAPASKQLTQPAL